MAGFGRCCCEDCLCLQAPELPIITMTGYTGGGWDSTECCWSQTFTPNTSNTWSKSCSPNIYEGSVEEECVTEHWRFMPSTYRGYEIEPSTCDDIPDQYCCPTKIKIATTTSTWLWENSGFMAFWKRLKHIVVMVSRETVDCTNAPGESGGCKIVIRSRAVYEYAYTFYTNDNFQRSQSVEIHVPSCFEADPNYVLPLNDPAEVVTCDNVPNEPMNFTIGGTYQQGCVSGGQFYFDRVKYFDEMPTGNLTYANEDIPGCTASDCNYEPYNYSASVCVYSPSDAVRLPYCVFQEPCYCLGTISQTDITFNQPPVVCNDSITIYSGCTGCEGQPFWMCDLTICPDVSDVCSESAYSRRCLGFEITIQEELNNFCFVAGIGGGEFNACGCSSGLDFNQTSPYLKSYNCLASCDSTCCQFIDDCPCCVEEQCRDRYGFEQWATVISHTRTQQCSGWSVHSFCQAAPTWTIILS